MLQVFLRIYFSVFDRGSGSVDEAHFALKCMSERTAAPVTAEARIGFAKANSGADAKSRLKDA